ncbi:MAG: hypothetical protein JJ855_05530 [Rhodospirillales bacterium]|nr:hypothetical protein [Rhodospirillales bacterium]
MNGGGEDAWHRRRRLNRLIRFFMVVVLMALALRLIIFLIEDGERMTPEEGAKLPPIETPAPAH